MVSADCRLSLSAYGRCFAHTVADPVDRFVMPSPRGRDNQGDNSYCLIWGDAFDPLPSFKIGPLRAVNTGKLP